MILALLLLLLENLSGDLTKTASSRKVSVPFSPLDVILEGMTCKAFIRELGAEATAKLQLSANEYYLKGKCLNNKARKQELIEIFATALPARSFADFILGDVGWYLFHQGS